MGLPKYLPKPPVRLSAILDLSASPTSSCVPLSVRCISRISGWAAGRGSSRLWGVIDPGPRIRRRQYESPQNGVTKVSRDRQPMVVNLGFSHIPRLCRAGAAPKMEFFINSQYLAIVRRAMSMPSALSNRPAGLREHLVRGFAVDQGAVRDSPPRRVAVAAGGSAMARKKKYRARKPARGEQGLVAATRLTVSHACHRSACRGG